MDPKKKSNTEFQIIPLPNGPYYYFTDFEPKVIDGIVNSRGEELRNLKGAALCRCGASIAISLRSPGTALVST